MDASEDGIELVNLGLPMLKELEAKCLVEMVEYIADNPQIIVNGFFRSGITGALRHASNQLEEHVD